MSRRFSRGAKIIFAAKRLSLQVSSACQERTACNTCRAKVAAVFADSGPRIAEIRDNLIARIAEAEREGWPGEVEGLKISLAGAEDKLTQIDRRSRNDPVHLGIPAVTHHSS